MSVDTLDVTRYKLKKRFEKEVRAFFRNPLGVIGLVGVMFLSLLAILAPLLAEPLPEFGNFAYRLLPPSPRHLFGTDDMALDIFSQVIWGARSSIRIGAIAVLVATCIGIPIGLISGYFGKVYDTIGMGLIEVFMTIPMLPLIIVVAAVTRSNSITTIAILIGMFAWPSVARIARSATIKVSSMQYIEAAKSLGIPSRSIIFKHVLLNIVSPVLVNLTIVMATSIITESAISFLGLGDPMAYSWGRILHNAYTSGAFSTAWWFSLFPGISIMLFVISFNFLSIGLRDAIDPKVSRQ